MDSGMFERKQDPARVRRADEQVQRMGYEFHCPNVAIAVKDGRLKIELRIENRGVAPFYHDWKPQWALLKDGKPVKSWDGNCQLTGLLPGEKPRLWSESLDVSGVKPGRYVVAVRVPTPLKGGKALRFANEGTDPTEGWLPLGDATLP